MQGGNPLGLLVYFRLMGVLLDLLNIVEIFLVFICCPRSYNFWTIGDALRHTKVPGFQQETPLSATPEISWNYSPQATKSPLLSFGCPQVHLHCFLCILNRYCQP